VNAGAAFSLYQSYITISPVIMYDLGLLAAGVGVKNYIGLTFLDAYTAPYVAVELGWFYLGAGMSFMLKAPDPAASDTGFTVPEPGEEGGILPFLTAGIAPPLFIAGPGNIGFNAAADFIVTASPVELVDDSGSVLGDIFGTILGTAVTAIFNSFKFGVSVFYSVRL